jgi:putative RNA 2'-phosphotransferase
MRNREYFIQLSKLLSLVLRHRPSILRLELDNHGFVPLGELLLALQEQPRWKEVTEEDILEVVNNSDKRRFEVVEGKIRALYGHSVSVQVEFAEMEPPPELYHGTARKSVSQILKEGLKPQGRRYVHLSVRAEDAVQVGKRRDDDPAILRVKTEEAYDSGVRFFEAGDSIVLAEEIPPEFLEIMS